MSTDLTPQTMKIGGRYNWQNQRERLVYLGLCEPRNGRWHQFAKVESPTEVWCEVQDDQISSFEETRVQVLMSPPPPSMVLVASMMAMVASAGVAQDVLSDIMPRPPRAQPRSKLTPEQRQEIKAWNAAVQAKRDAKKARKGRA